MMEDLKKEDIDKKKEWEKNNMGKSQKKIDDEIRNM